MKVFRKTIFEDFLKDSEQSKVSWEDFYAILTIKHIFCFKIEIFKNKDL